MCVRVPDRGRVLGALPAKLQHHQRRGPSLRKPPTPKSCRHSINAASVTRQPVTRTELNRTELIRAIERDPRIRWRSTASLAIWSESTGEASEVSSQRALVPSQPSLLPSASTSSSSFSARPLPRHLQPQSLSLPLTARSLRLLPSTAPYDLHVFRRSRAVQEPG